MPNGLFSADIQFPQFTGAETEREKLEKIQSYLFVLLEQLRFTLSNVDKGNFNEAGLLEISEEIAGHLVKKYESLDIKITEGDSEDEARIQITGDGIKAEAKILEFGGMVTFGALENEDEQTLINGAYIKTGTIDTMELKGNEIKGGTVTGTTVNGSRFICSYETDGFGNNKSFGDILMEYGGAVRGGLQMSDKGEGTAESSRHRIWLYAQNGFVLKLDSETRISIEAGDQIYIATSGGASISLSGNKVEIKGNVYVNGTPIGG